MTKKTKCMLAGFISASILASLTGCSSGNNENSEKADTQSIAVITKAMGPEYWDIVEQGAKTAGNDLKINVSYSASDNDSDYKTQIALMNQAVEDGADALVIAPCDCETDELINAMKNIASNGTKIFLIDSDIDDDFKTACVATDNAKSSEIAFEKAKELVGDGEIAIVGHSEASQTCIDRKIAFDNAENLVDIQYSQNDIIKAADVTKNIIDNNPDVKLIYATNEISTKGVCQVVKQYETENKIAKDQIQIIGFDYSDSEREYIESGLLDGVLVQNPYNIGYQGVETAFKSINGENVEKFVDTGITWVCGDNIGQSDIVKIINPLNK